MRPDPPSGPLTFRNSGSAPTFCVTIRNTLGEIQCYIVKLRNTITFCPLKKTCPTTTKPDRFFPSGLACRNAGLLLYKYRENPTGKKVLYRFSTSGFPCRVCWPNFAVCTSHHVSPGGAYTRSCVRSLDLYKSWHGSFWTGKT